MTDLSAIRALLGRPSAPDRRATAAATQAAAMLEHRAFEQARRAAELETVITAAFGPDAAAVDAERRHYVSLARRLIHRRRGLAAALFRTANDGLFGTPPGEEALRAAYDRVDRAARALEVEGKRVRARMGTGPAVAPPPARRDRAQQAADQQRAESPSELRMDPEACP
jgi:hypothetical protein